MRKIEEQIIASLQQDNRFASTPIKQDGRPRQLCLVEPINVFGRKQPVSVELIPLAHDSVEALSLKTPLGGEAAYLQLLQKYPIFQFPYEQEYPMVKMCYDPSTSEEDLFRVYLRLDIPIMPLIQQQNPLSSYELSEALKDLVECGDLIERLAISDQDIDISDLDSGNSLDKNLGETLLRKQVFSDVLGNDWQRSFNQKYVFLSGVLPDISSESTTHWEANHLHPFVKFTAFRGQTEASLTYFSKDLQTSEQEFLSPYFNALLKQQLSKAEEVSP